MEEDLRMTARSLVINSTKNNPSPAKYKIVSVVCNSDINAVVSGYNLFKENYDEDAPTADTSDPQGLKSLEDGLKAGIPFIFDEYATEIEVSAGELIAYYLPI